MDSDLIKSPVYRPEDDTSSHLVTTGRSAKSASYQDFHLSRSNAFKLNFSNAESNLQTDNNTRSHDQQPTSNQSNKDSENFELGTDLDVVQKYLRQTRPDGEYNDEIIATYLSCNGLLDMKNRCLQRLVCQYADPTAIMPELEKEVASL